ncbi:MAG: PIG-L family deacetylase [Treponema sp.]|jgi:LmbE family N-acetylglucosaminyl deacetylase|nr:PIG-L family deacetylase [Treponema sp.]
MKKLNIMAIGAHPDDCDFFFGGTALKFKAQGHELMFLSMTNGCSGHQLEPGPALAARRYGEIQAVSKLTGITYKMTDIPDGSLTAELRYRDLLMREIRAFIPDLIFTHRPNDYHPDHRSTGTLVMDCSYLVIVPHVVPDSPPLKKAPGIFHMHDRFTFPGPFVPDVVVSIDDVMDQKTAMLDCHVSQVYEFLPWAGNYTGEVPQDPKGRFQWLKTFLRGMEPSITGRYREILERRYGDEKSGKILDCEAFQLCEYGAQMTPEDLDMLFPL